jgi:hypothetical protein
MAEGKPPLVANVAEFNLEDDEDETVFPEDNNDMASDLPPDFALLGSISLNSPIPSM